MSSQSRKRLRSLAPALLVAVLFAACREQTGSAPPPEQRAAFQASDRYDLARDESRGGHTLARHVGKSDAELRERLEGEPISAASTYSDRPAAEMAVRVAIRQNQGNIDNWLHRIGGHPNLAIDYSSNTPLGRCMRRRDMQSFPCSHAIVILKWVSPEEYYVLTSYPDCKRPL